jgi:colanic acid biosynthesis glycosyl transferase WcaI
LPLQPRDEYYNIINSSDINLISLDGRMKAPCLPGKTINLFAAGKPVIAIVGRESETANIVQKNQSGIVIEPGNRKSLKKVILALTADDDYRRKLGESAREYFEKNMVLEKNVADLVTICKKIISQNTKKKVICL